MYFTLGGLWVPPRKKPVQSLAAPAPGVLAHVRSQIDSAASDLNKYRPVALNWHDRALQTAEELVPWFVGVAPGMKDHVQDVLNAPVTLRSLWKSIRKHVNLPAEQIEAFDRQLTLDDVLRESVTGGVVSNVVTQYLIDHGPQSGLRSNGRSYYPDLYLANRDYSALPQSKKVKDAEQDEYGTTLKGVQKYPSRVPDGLEVKTCRKRIAVDCHHPHAGLHLVVLFTEVSRAFTVTDVCVAFLWFSDYRESKRNTTATTVKYSFGGDRFVSVLSPGAPVV